MGNTKISLLISLLACAGKKESPYTKASVNKLLKLLEKIHKIKIGRRWLFQCLADLIDAGLITRRPRHKHEKDGTIRQLSSLISFTLQGARFLVAKRVEGSLLLLKSILAWMKNLDKRFPTTNEILPATSDEIDPEEIRRFKALAEMVGKPMPG